MAENKKVLLMGPGGCGKTSMRSIIFANFVAKDTFHIISTVDVDHSQVKFLGNLVLNLWDCGGQDLFFESYFSSKKEHIFRNVAVLIFVFDVQSTYAEKDLGEYRKCIDSLAQYSKDSKVFCLVHKMDVIPKDQRDKIFEKERNRIKQNSSHFAVECFQTSIWEETLYKAWSTIVYSLIPNADNLYQSLNKFCILTEAEEVVLFERSTFLGISHATNSRSVNLYKDGHRFEKISNIIKMIKLSCLKTGTSLLSMEVHNSRFDAFIYEFTDNTYIMLVFADLSVQPAATLLNIKNARPHFQNLMA